MAKEREIACGEGLQQLECIGMEESGEGRGLELDWSLTVLSGSFGCSHS